MTIGECLKRLSDRLGVVDTILSLLLFLFCLFEGFSAYRRGIVDPALAIAIFILCLFVLCCLIYLVCRDEIVYRGGFGYKLQHSYDFIAKDDRLTFAVKHSPFLVFLKTVLGCLFFGLLISYLCDFYFFVNLPLNFFFLMFTGTGYYCCSTKEQTFYFENGKYLNFRKPQKIADFSIVQKENSFDLEMCLDDSKKIKLISNTDEEYLKKIESELREFLGCSDKSSVTC